MSLEDGARRRNEYRRSSPGGTTRLSDIYIAVFLGIISLIVSYVLLDKLGVLYFVVVLGGATAVFLLGFVTFRNISFALSIWLLSMCGFRTLGMVNMPGLPDMSIDRILLVWMILFFFFRVVVGAQKIEKPFLADVILLLTTIYIVVQIQFKNSPHFHFWVLSYLSPFFAYIYGKYTVKKDFEIRNIIFFFLILTVYFYITAIAEHFGWNSLVIPKSILDPHKGFWIPGRARGPLLHPPLFGQVLAMSLLVHFFLMLHLKRKISVALLSLSLGLSFLALFFTYTRGPWVAGMAGILSLGFLGKGYRKVIAIMVVVGFLGAIAGAVQLANSEFLQERVSNTHTIENRLGFFANAIRMFMTDPLFGVGFFNFQSLVDDFNQATYIPFYGLIRKDVAANVPIHDIYIGKMAEEGLVGTILQFSFYWVIFRAYISRWKENVWSRWFTKNTMVLFAGIMITYLVGGMIIDYRYFDLVNVVFYLLAGIIYGFNPRKAGAEGQSPISGYSSLPVSW